VIRALAVGEIRSKDWLRVLSREVIIGIAIGLCLGLIGFMRAFLFGEGQAAIQLAVIAGTGILCIVTLGTIIGSLLPIAIRKAGLDPAVSSAPFIASLIDVIGLIVYFGLARWVIGGGLL
jgi:magnesium transporter